MISDRLAQGSRPKVAKPKSRSAINMEARYREMQIEQSRNYLKPYLKQFQKKSADNKPPTKRDLQQLACFWKLNKIPGFWNDNPTTDDLLRTLYRHAKKLEESRGSGRGDDPFDDMVEDGATTTASGEPGAHATSSLSSSMKWHYKGDIFSSTGGYEDGMIYASRSGGPHSASALKKKKKKRSSILGSGEGADGNGFDPRDSKDADLDDETADVGGALVELRLSSTATIADTSRDPEARAKLLETTSPSTVFDTWRKSTNRDIKRNCAITLAFMFLSTDVENDDMLMPVFNLVSNDPELEVRVAGVEALLRRLEQHKPVDSGYFPGLIAAVQAIEAMPGVSVECRRNSVRVLLLTILWTRRGVNSGPPFGRRRSVSSLASIGEDDSSGAHLGARLGLQHGIISLIQGIMTSSPDDVTIQETCIKTLVQLANYPPSHADLGASSLVGVLIQLLESPNTGVAEESSQVLFQLCTSEDPISRVITADPHVVSALVTIVGKQADSVEASGPDQLDQLISNAQSSLSALLALSKQESLTSTLRDAGLPAILFKWLNCSQADEHTRSTTLLILCALFDQPPLRADLLAKGFTQALVAKIEATAPSEESLAKLNDSKAEGDYFEDDSASQAGSKTSQGALDLSDDGVATECARSLGVLVRMGAIDSFMDAEGLHPLLRLAASGGRASPQAFEVLEVLAASELSRPKMLEQRVVSRILECVKSMKNLRALRAATGTLCTLTQSPESHEYLLEIGIIPALAGIIKPTGLESTVVLAFSQLSANRGAHSQLIENGAVELFVNRSRETDPTVRLQCAQALYNLSAVIGQEPELITRDVATALTIVALFKSDEGRTQDLCSAALFNLMYDESGREKLMQDGVLWAFVRLAQSSNSKREEPGRSGTTPSPITAAGSSSAPSPPNSPPRMAGSDLPGSSGKGASKRPSAIPPRLKHLRSDSTTSLLDMNPNSLVEEGKSSVKVSATPDDVEAPDGVQTCTRLMNNLACDVRLVAQIVEKRVLSVISDFAQIPGRSHMMNIACTLCEVTRHDNLLPSLLANGGVALTWALVQSGRLEVTSRAVTAFLRMTKNKTCLNKLVASSMSSASLCDGIMDVISRHATQPMEAQLDKNGQTRRLFLSRTACGLAAVMTTLSNHLSPEAEREEPARSANASGKVNTLGKHGLMSVATRLASLANVPSLLEETLSDALGPPSAKEEGEDGGGEGKISSLPSLIVTQCLQTCYNLVLNNTGVGKSRDGIAGGFSPIFQMLQVVRDPAPAVKITQLHVNAVIRLVCHLTATNHEAAEVLCLPELVQALSGLCSEYNDASTQCGISAVLANVCHTSSLKTQRDAMPAHHFVRLLDKGLEDDIAPAVSAYLASLQAFVGLWKREAEEADAKSSAVDGDDAGSGAGGEEGKGEDDGGSTATGDIAKLPSALEALMEADIVSVISKVSDKCRAKAAQLQGASDPDALSTFGQEEFLRRAQQVCVDVFSVLSGWSSARDAMVEAGALQALSKLVRSGDKSIKGAAVTVFERLSRLSRHRRQLVQAKAVPTLTALAADSTLTKSSKRLCASILHRIESDASLSAEKLENAGVVQSVLLLRPLDTTDPDAGDSPAGNPWSIDDATGGFTSPIHAGAGGAAARRRLESDAAPFNHFEFPRGWAPEPLGSFITFPGLNAVRDTAGNSSGVVVEAGESGGPPDPEVASDAIHPPAFGGPDADAVEGRVDPDTLPLWDKVLDLQGQPVPPPALLRSSSFSSVARPASRLSPMARKSSLALFEPLDDNDEDADNQFSLDVSVRAGQLPPLEPPGYDDGPKEVQVVSLGPLLSETQKVGKAGAGASAGAGAGADADAGGTRLGESRGARTRSPLSRSTKGF